MELQRGVCFLCSNVKVITASETRKANEIICSLLSENILNVEEFNNIQSALKLCPVCYHKLSILKCIRENIETGGLEDDPGENCFICKNGKTLFKAIDWPHLDSISEDFVIKNADQRIICSDCLFYLDARYEVKTKLFSKYPQLNVKWTGTKNKQKLRSRNSTELVPQLTPIEGSKVEKSIKKITSVSENKKKKTFPRQTSVEINTSLEDKEDSSKQIVNFSFIKTLKPLKYNKFYKRHRIIKADPKFLNQVLYVLLETSAIRNNGIHSKIASIKGVGLQNDLVNSECKTDSSELIKSNKNRRHFKQKSMIIKRNLNEHVIIKDLIVNLSRIKLSQKMPHKFSKSSLESNPVVKNLNDILDISESCSDKMNVEDKIPSSDFDMLQTRQTEIKSKRKSVSFAEDKNVEIEYFPTNPKIISKKVNSRDNIPENRSFVELNIRKRRNKTDVIDNEDDTKSERSTEDECQISDRLLNSSDGYISNEEVHENTESIEEIENNQNVEDSPDKSKRTDLIKSCSKETEEQNENVEEQSVGKVKKVPKKYKPKPLSKKIKIISSNLLTSPLKDTNEINTCENYMSDNNKELIDSQNIDSCHKIVSKENSETESCKTNRLEYDTVDVTEQEGNLFSSKNECVNVKDVTRNGVETSKPKEFSEVNESTVDLNLENNEKEEKKISSGEVSEEEGELKDSDEQVSDEQVSDEQKSLSNEKTTSVPISLDNTVDTICTTEEKEHSELTDEYVKDKGKVDISEESEGSRNVGESEDLTNEKFEQIDRNLNDENEELDRNVVEINETDSENSANDNNTDSNTFSEIEKPEDTGITEDDQDNINSILSTFILQQDKLEDRTSAEKDFSESENYENVENSNATDSNKRKIIDDVPLNTVVDKKKKKVTFCEDVA